MSPDKRATTAASHERASRLTGFGLAALSAALWATGGLSAKWLFTPLDAATSSWPIPPLGIEIDPLMLSACRALLAFGMLLAYTLVARRQALAVRGRDLPFLAFFGVAGLALVHFTYFKTISLTGVATAILLEYLAPVIVLAASVVTVRDRWTWTLPVSVALSVTGCAAVVGAFSGTGLVVSPQGLLWGLLSAVFFAGYTLMGRWAAHRFSSWTLLTYGLGAATIFWVIVLGGPGSMGAQAHPCHRGLGDSNAGTGPRGRRRMGASQRSARLVTDPGRFAGHRCDHRGAGARASGPPDPALNVAGPGRPGGEHRCHPAGAGDEW